MQMIEDDFDIKKKVEQVLTDTGFMDQRAAKMGVDELLKYAAPRNIKPSLISARSIGCSPLFTTLAYTLLDVIRPPFRIVCEDIARNNRYPPDDPDCASTKNMIQGAQKINILISCESCHRFHPSQNFDAAI